MRSQFVERKLQLFMGSKGEKKGEWIGEGIEREQRKRETETERGTGRETDSLIVKLIKLIIGR